MPTVASSGLPDCNVLEWYGVLGPKDLPAEVVETINKAVNEILKDPVIIEKTNADGFAPAGGTAAEFKDRIVSGIDRWKQVAKDMNIQPQ